MDSRILEKIQASIWNYSKLLCQVALVFVLLFSAQCSCDVNDCHSVCGNNQDFTRGKLCLKDYCDDSGCRYAEETYAADILDVLNSPTAPFASGISSHNVTLKWGPANDSGVQYVPQWTYSNQPGAWRSTESVCDFSYTVRNLLPGTQYQFRVVWILTSQLMLYSPQSGIYTTTAYGVPSSAPVFQNVECLTPETVEVSWSPPPFPGGSIVGYNLKLSSINQELHRAAGSNELQMLLYPTTANTTYRLKESPYILAAGKDGIWKHQVEKFDPGILIYPDIKQATHIDWYNSTIFWSDLAGHVHMMPPDSNVVLVSGILQAGSLAFDWLGQHLYWAGLASKTIYRTALTSMQTEVVAQVRHLVIDFVVDSVNAFLYWTTSLTVECARLNGEKHQVFQEHHLFSNKQVFALASDLNLGHLYWLVQDGMYLHLYRVNLLREGFVDTSITEFAAWSSLRISRHGLQFYSGRLFWLDGNNTLTVQEVNQSSSVPLFTATQLRAFTLVHVSMKPLPDGYVSTPIVIPQSVPISSIRIEGNYSIARVVWNASRNVEYGTVFYCVESETLQLHENRSNKHCLPPNELSTPAFEVNGLQPHTKFDISITPYTYWGKGQTTMTILQTPTGVTSAPRRPRIFVSSHDSFGDAKVVQVEFRWDVPEYENGVIVKYSVHYSVWNNSNANRTHMQWKSVNTSITSYKLNSVPHGFMVLFQVEAFTSVGPGEMSSTSQANTSVLIPVPRIVIATEHFISLFDVDLNKTVQNVPARVNTALMAYTADSGMLYYIQHDTLFATKIIDGSKSQVLKDSQLVKTTCMTVDWIGRRIFIAQDTTMNTTLLFEIDLELKTIMLKKVVNPSSAVLALAVYPLLSRLYWIERSAADTRMVYYDFANKTVHHVFKSQVESNGTRLSSNRNECNCTETKTELGAAMALDTTGLQSDTIVFTTQTGEIWMTDLEGCSCKRVIRVPLQLGEILGRVTVDKQFIYWTTSIEENVTIYQAEKENENQMALFTVAKPVSVSAYSPLLQPLPDKNCLIPAAYTEKPRILNATNSSFSLELPPCRPQLHCQGVSVPTPTYLLHYGNLKDGNSSFSCSQGLQCTVLEFHQTIVHLKGLQPYSFYVIQTAVKNYYGGFPEFLGEADVGKTLYGTPESVANFTISVFSDTAVNISWTEPSQPNGPVEKIRYQVIINILEHYPPTPLMKTEFPQQRLAWSVSSLKGGTSNNFVVLSFHPDEDWFTASVPVLATTFQSPLEPYNIIPRNTSVKLEWRAPIDNNTRSFTFELSEIPSKSKWFQPKTTDCNNGSSNICELFGLDPNRIYYVRVKVTYKTDGVGFSPAKDFTTTAGVPGKPGAPSLWMDETMIGWDKAADNGCNIIYYILESRKLQTESLLLNQSGSVTWEVVHNDSCSSSFCTWKVRNLLGTFQFRAAAANLVGLGEYSDVSRSIMLNGHTPSNGAFIAVTVVIAVLIVLMGVFGFGWYRRRKIKQSPSNRLMVYFKPDAELAEIRGLASSVGLVNACYAISFLPTESGRNSLPGFPRERLRLCCLLGSGAFGEVYEGVALDILGKGSGETKVAVKTLKNVATDHEKAEFLKEAHLMSQFDHPHILKLLGVCLMNEPHFIILELMKGGDLRTYLREARATRKRGSLLSILDLLDVCVDVSKGCAYLEKMHFVHRDLAARNCLVSVKEYGTPERLVKIGDFGLARDIYKNDYYRKRGEGLLPVRWMAPESLIDGVFTKYSDVWSFGVLLWEIITLGEQPYPAYSNLEVLHLVRSGGRLPSPTNCPDDIYDLMQKCWHKEPSMRPSFQYIQDRVEQLRKSPLSCSHSYDDSIFPSGVINHAFEDAEDDCIEVDRDGVPMAGLTPTQNNEGLNYLMFQPENAESEERNEQKSLCFVSTPDSQMKACKEPNVETSNCCDEFATSENTVLNYASITVPSEGESVSC
ncbi:proto-oncogene tyrosine-protein kinase ROS-like [Polyodon spathula]|uniref:proto-oncogene tyrosine-protein kinase ROS-like n=1 Tax=Polyodon spathula TaxID=7913 RepID=UPI001B7DD894|nr:proto-oncogene tyrosine-protein kinase ROS-like [Polyodon spathula]